MQRSFCYCLHRDAALEPLGQPDHLQDALAGSLRPSGAGGRLPQTLGVTASFRSDQPSLSMATAQVFNLPSDQQMREQLLLLASYLLELKNHSPEERPTTWLSPVRWEPLDIDPAREADALVANVFKFLSEQYGVGGHRGQALTFEKMPLKSMAAYAATGGNLTSRLGLVYYDKSLFALVVSHGVV